MTSTNGKSAFALFSAAFFFTILFVGATVQNNREIAQRRLNEPVATIGELISYECTVYTRVGKVSFQQPIGILKYEYSMSGMSAQTYVFRTTEIFETLAQCAHFAGTAERRKTIWYEKANPAKASRYESEDYQWYFLYGLAISALFFVGGIYAMKASKNRQKTAQRKVKKKWNPA